MQQAFRKPQLPVRLLHARLRHDGVRAARRGRRSRARTRSARARRQPVPLHRLPVASSRRQARGGCAEQEASSERATAVQRAVRRRRDSPARRGPAHPDRSRPVHRRPASCPGCCTPPSCAARSPHARITRIDVERGAGAPGVVAVFTGADMGAVMQPGSRSAGARPASIPRSIRSRRQGPLRRRFGRDGRRREPLPGRGRARAGRGRVRPVASRRRHTRPRSIRRSRRCSRSSATTSCSTMRPMSCGDVDAAFAEADRVIDATLRQHRSPTCRWSRGAVADFDPASGELDLSTRRPGPTGLRLAAGARARRAGAAIPRLTPDVGGGVRLEGHAYREDFAGLAASKLLGRPVKWIEDRHENLRVGPGPRGDDRRRGRRSRTTGRSSA